MTDTPLAAADALRLRHALADRLTAAGRIHSPEWRAAFEAVPRQLFVPRFYRHSGDAWELIDGADPAQRQQWLRAVYSDETLIIQMAEVPVPEELGGGTYRQWTSSSTAPGLMTRMLEELEVFDGARVLEVGTGSGYNAALLCARLGDAHVVSVDISEELVTTAAGRLAAAGHRPRLVAGDGAAGVSEAAPFDRIIATCAVRAIPPAWLEQTATGGILLTDLRGQLGGTLVKLRKQPDGSAIGRFLPEWAGFMYLRHEEATALPFAPAAELADDPITERATTVDPGLLVEDRRFTFLAQLCLPHGHLALTSGEDGEPAVRLTMPTAPGAKSAAALGQAGAIG